MNKGRILLLNGPSSAGKTTLAWEIQSNARDYWYWLPIDHFFDAVPSRQWDNDEDSGFNVAFDLHHDCVKLISDQGKDVIVDTVICSLHSFASFATKLAGYPVIMVKVACPIEELNRREAARGDRDIGLAAGQADIMVPRDGYDLIADTHALSVNECACRIMDLLANPIIPPTAFMKLAVILDSWSN